MIYIIKKTLKEAVRVVTLDPKVTEKDKTLKAVIKRLKRLFITPGSNIAFILAIEKGKEKELVILWVFLNIKKKEKYLKDYRIIILIIM